MKNFDALGRPIRHAAMEGFWIELSPATSAPHLGFRHTARPRA